VIYYCAVTITLNQLQYNYVICIKMHTVLLKTRMKNQLADLLKNSNILNRKAWVLFGICSHLEVTKHRGI